MEFYIELATTYFRYVYPGYITIYIYLFIRGISSKDTNAILLKSIVISYIYNTVIYYFANKRDIKWIDFILLSVSVLVAFVVEHIIKSDYLRVILDIYGISTKTALNELDSVIGEDADGYCIIELKNGIIFEGFLQAYEADIEVKNRFISLCAYKKSINRECIYDGSLNQDRNVIIYLSDVISIEVLDEVETNQMIQQNIEEINKQ